MIASGVTVMRGATLRLGAGTVVKLNKSSVFEIQGKLFATGTADAPVLFTSINDTDFPRKELPKVVLGSPVVISRNEDGYLLIGKSDKSIFERVTWSSDSQGGRSGSAYVASTTAVLGSPPLVYGTDIEAIISDDQIDGACSTPRYTGDIYADFSCALAFASERGIPVSLYSMPPKAGDWTFPLYFSQGSEASLSHAIVRYGGEHACSSGCTDNPMVLIRDANVGVSSSTFSSSPFAAVSIEGGGLNIQGSLFYDMPDALRAAGGTLAVHNSDFDVAGSGLYIPSAYSGIADATGNWWGDPAGPKHYDAGGAIAGVGAWAYPRAAYEPWLTSRQLSGATSTGGLPPAQDPAPSARNPVIIMPGLLGSLELAGKWVLDPIFHTYQGLIDSLVSAGYEASSTLFTFPYDWRKPNAETAGALKKKIDEIKALCKCGKVDIVAHSMGGLVARSYAESLGYAGDIGRIVFLGTPHRGVPLDYALWEAGQFGTTLWGRVLEAVFAIYAKTKGYAGIYDFIRNYPVATIQEILPIYDYLRSASTSRIAAYPLGYPKNEFLEDIDRGLSAFLQSGISVRNIISDAPSSTAVTLAISVASSSGEWRDGRLTSYEYGAGDGTVPYQSARLGDAYDVILRADHDDLPTAAEAQAVEIISGKKGSVSVPSSAHAHRALVISMNSPADMVLTSPDGKKTGRDIETGTDVADISGSFYSGAESSAEYMVLLDPVETGYRLVVQGTGTGEYSIGMKNVSADSSLDSVYVGTTSPGNVSVFDLSVPTSSDPILVPEQATLTAEVGLSKISSPSGGGFSNGMSQRVGQRIVSLASVVVIPTAATDTSDAVFMDVPLGSFIENYRHIISQQQKQPAIPKAVPTFERKTTATASAYESLRGLVKKAGKILLRALSELFRFANPLILMK